MNVILIGYRGTGKSTIGRRVAELLSIDYVSLDEEIVRRSGMSIPEIVESGGWDRFREIEEEVVEAETARDGRVVDCGGGVVTRPRNIERLRSAGIVVLLEARPADIASRIGGDSQRPSLTGASSFTEEVEEVLAQREPLYRRAAHHAIDTSRLSADEAAREIARIYREARQT
ncbi:MAG: shikimate kinase [Planctomycetes bacterium]|nr:shikimate kinase [Planctomycetota bacterium]